MIYSQRTADKYLIGNRATESIAKEYSNDNGENDSIDRDSIKLNLIVYQKETRRIPPAYTKFTAAQNTTKRERNRLYLDKSEATTVTKLPYHVVPFRY